MADEELQGRYTLIDHPGSTLIYGAASGLERALADVEGERILKIPDWLITDQWSPYDISATNLPYLAFGMGVTLWEDDYWSEGTKRDWVARQWTFKSLRGTISGVRMALEPSGYVLTDSVRPEQGFYAAPQLSKEEWDAWIRLMPELRIFFQKREGTRGDDEFFVDDETLDDISKAQTGFADQDASSIHDGFVLRGRYAVIRHLGVDAPVHMIEYHPDAEDLDVVDYERLSTEGKSSVGLLSDEDYVDDDRYVCFEETAPKLYTLRLDRQYSHDLSTLALTSIVPDLEPLTPRYERNSDIGDGGPFFFIGDFAVDREFADYEDGAPRLLADRIYLLDPNVAEPMTEGISFADVSRVGIPPFLAELQIDLRHLEQSRSFFVEDVFADDDAYVVPQDNSHIERGLRAVVAAKALRDTALVSFAPKRPIQLSDYLTATTNYGDWIAEPL